MICIFCSHKISGKNKSREHVIPQWIIKELGIEKKQLAFIGISPKHGVKSPIKPTPNSFVHKICKNCNNGWLHDIDESCIEILSLMMDYQISDEQLLTLTTNISIPKLYTFIYKIFLNFFATSPEIYREDKLFFYKHFYENKKPIHGTEFFICNQPADEIFAITHLNDWLAYERITEGYSEFDFPDMTLSFKFYIQLGAVSFILCNTGTYDHATIYDSSKLFPLVIKNSSIAKVIKQEEYIDPTINLPSNSILYNSLLLSLKKINK